MQPRRGRFRAKLSDFQPRTCSCLDRRRCFGAKFSDFQPRTCSCFFSLDRRRCFGAKFSDFQPRTCSSLDRRGCFGAKFSDFQPRTCSCLDRRRCFGAKFSDFQPRTCSCFFFLPGSKTLLWSEIQRFSASNMQLFFLSGEEAVGAKLIFFWQVRASSAAAAALGPN